MKKFYLAIVIIIVLVIGYLFISGDTENRIARIGVSYFDGDYVITHYGLSGTNVWLVKNGKVTSESSKGYYHTRVLVKGNKTAYLQIPINNTVIEEYVTAQQLTNVQATILTKKIGQGYLIK